MSKRIGLSKSRITLFEQCPKRLWLSVHRPEAADVSASVRAGFADGHRVGALASEQYPDGAMIDGAAGLGAALRSIRQQRCWQVDRSAPCSKQPLHERVCWSGSI